MEHRPSGGSFGRFVVPDAILAARGPRALAGEGSAGVTADQGVTTSQNS